MECISAGACDYALGIGNCIGICALGDADIFDDAIAIIKLNRNRGRIACIADCIRICAAATGINGITACTGVNYISAVACVNHVIARRACNCIITCAGINIFNAADFIAIINCIGVKVDC